jgi:hypothetical protein
MSKKFKSNLLSSKQIEEDIYVPFKVVATPKWLEQSVGNSILQDDQVIRVSSSKTLEPILQWCRHQPILGIDSETGGDNKRDGLNPLSPTSRMLIFQLGTPEMVYLIEPALVQDFKEVLEDSKILKIGQNIIHDFKFTVVKAEITLVKHHYDPSKDACVPEAYDTMLSEQILSAGLFGVQVGLEELAEKYPPHRLISKDVRKEFIDMTGVLEYRHLYYAARDVYLLFDIMKGQKERAKKYPGIWDRIQLEMCAIYGTADAELTGFDLDERIIGLAIEYQEKRAGIIRHRCMEIFNDILNKTGQKRKFILEDMLETFDMDSPGQKLSALQRMGFDLKDVKRETLKELNSEITNLLGDYTECTKVISTYGDGLLRKKKADGRVHPEFNQLGAGDIEARKGKAGKATTIATGRWSSDAQQFPRPEHILEPVIGSEAEQVLGLFSEQYQEAMNKLTQETLNG